MSKSADWPSRQWAKGELRRADELLVNAIRAVLGKRPLYRGDAEPEPRATDYVTPPVDHGCRRVAGGVRLVIP